jgi:hypothetical protein
MEPVLRYGLSVLGICRIFPRNLVFAPIKYMGLGLPHLYTIQEISSLKDIISHMYNSTTTGYLYQTKLELLFLKVGMGMNLHQINFEISSQLATDYLVKSSWSFLDSNNLRLHHIILFPHKQLDDKMLMAEFLKAGASKDDLSSLNRCRLHLKAYIFVRYYQWLWH